MKLYIEDNKIQWIFYFHNPDGNMFPEKDVTNEQRILKDFRWIPERRPATWMDIFRKF
jgi:hypothetical protein